MAATRLVPVVRQACSTSGPRLATVDADYIVSVLRAARGSEGARIGDCGEADMSETDAYHVQQHLHMALSPSLGPVVGTKVGCTTGVMQNYLGMSAPCFGGIYESTAHKGHVKLTHRDYHKVGVECEIAVILKSTIHPRNDGSLHTKDSVADSVGRAMAAIEIVDDRYVDFENRTPDWPIWVADDFFGAGCVLAEDGAQTDWRDLDLSKVTGRMQINGKEVGSGVGADIIEGHPLEALVWLANKRSARGEEIPAGHIVMLGSVVQTKWLQPGDLVECDVTGLGCVSAVFGE
eukprot:m.462126 g.462126  ORF g.462126 m.462126 type:complete len:291 (+) comp22527_c0_seq1:58-930(+)